MGAVTAMLKCYDDTLYCLPYLALPLFAIDANYTFGVRAAVDGTSRAI